MTEEKFWSFVGLSTGGIGSGTVSSYLVQGGLTAVYTPRHGHAETSFDERENDLRPHIAGDESDLLSVKLLPKITLGKNVSVLIFFDNCD